MKAYFYAVIAAFFAKATFAQEQALIDYRCLGGSANTCYVVIDGPITKGLTERVINLHAEAWYLYLNSQGGDLGEALKLGRHIRTTGWGVSLGAVRPAKIESDGSKSIFDDGFPSGGECNSACAYAFMGGASRSLGPNDRLGFHRFWSPSGKIDGDDAQIISGQLINYLIEMDIDPAVYKIAALTDPEAMYLLSPEEAEEYNIVTDDGYKDLNLEPYRSGIIAWTRPNREERTGGFDQITFLCKSHVAEIFILVGGYSELLKREYLPDFEITIDGEYMPVSSQKLSLRPAGDGVYLTVPLSSASRDTLLNAEEVQLVGRWGLLSGSGVLAIIRFSNLDREKLKVAFTQCVQ